MDVLDYIENCVVPVIEQIQDLRKQGSLSPIYAQSLVEGLLSLEGDIDEETNERIEELLEVYDY